MKGWTDEEIEDLRDYIALGYALDFIAAITERRRDAVQAMIDALGIGPSPSDIPEVTKPSGAGQATAAAFESPTADVTSVQEAPAGASAGVQGRYEPTPAPFPAAPEPSRAASAAILDKPARDLRWDEMTREERIAEISSRRRSGSSNSQIAIALHTSRGAICGFSDRHKDQLPPSDFSAPVRTGGAKKPRAPRQPRAPSMVSPMPAIPRQKPQALPPEPVLPPDPAAVVPLIEAGARRCHFPLWGNARPAPTMLDGLACGMPAPEGQSYCAHHHVLTHSMRGLAPVSESEKSTFIFPKRRAAA